MGFNLVEVSSDVWVLKVVGEDSSFVGSFRDVVKHAVTRYNFRFQEIDKAVESMVQGNHNSAHFGSQSSFMCAFTQDLAVERKVC